MPNYFEQLVRNRLDEMRQWYAEAWCHEHNKEPMGYDNEIEEWVCEDCMEG